MLLLGFHLHHQVVVAVVQVQVVADHQVAHHHLVAQDHHHLVVRHLHYHGIVQQIIQL